MELLLFAWMIAAACTLLPFLLLSHLHIFKTSKIQYPPSPTKLPIIGNLHQIIMGGELVHITLAAMAKKHGQVFTLWAGHSQPTIVVSHHSSAREVLVTKSSHFSSRKLPTVSKFMNANYRTIVSSNFGQHWQSLRKSLHDTVLGPSAISAHKEFHHEHIRALVGAIREEAAATGGVVRPLPHLRRSTISLISRLIFGPGCAEEEFLTEMDDTIEEVVKLTGHVRPLHVFHFLKYFPGLRRVSFHHRSTSVKRRIEALILPYISTHLSKHECDGCCYVHSLLSHGLSEEEVIFCVFEVFLLGVDSTSNAIQWALAFLIRDPRVQQKLYGDLCKGDNGNRESEEIRKDGYLKAVVKETMRMKPIAPLAVPHMAARDSSIEGMKVPAGTPVIVNVYAVLRDPDVWEEALRFLPERFMSSSIKEKEVESFIPFGAGLRICAGMELGKEHVSLCLAGLMRSFHWLPEKDGELPDMSDSMTFVLTMKCPLAARILPRLAYDSNSFSDTDIGFDILLTQPGKSLN